MVHPVDCFHAVPDEMMRVIFTLMTQEPSQIARERAATLKQWTQWARELAADEKKLFAQLDAGVANVLKGKRLLLLERIANSIGWPDTRLFAEMRAGFMIVGMQEPSGIFGLEPRPASYSVDELCSASKFLRPALLGKVRSAEDSDVAEELWQITPNEATNEEWMVGPLEVDEVRARHGEHWIPVRRFGIRQSSGDKVKLRPIDDYAENRVNGAYAYSDKLELRTLDHITWSATAIARFGRSGTVRLVLSSGEVLEAPLSKALSSSDNWQPLLTVLDLASAYKQFAIHPSCRKYSIVALKRPGTNAVQCFEGLVLPFGSTASVVRVSTMTFLFCHRDVLLTRRWNVLFRF